MSKEEQRDKNSLNCYLVNWENAKGSKYFLQTFVAFINKKTRNPHNIFDVINNANCHELGLKTPNLKKQK